MESRFGDPAFARKAYATVVRRIIDSGVRALDQYMTFACDNLRPQTTTCCYYGTLHLEATKILAEFVHSAGEHHLRDFCLFVNSN